MVYPDLKQVDESILPSDLRLIFECGQLLRKSIIDRSSFRNQLCIRDNHEQSLLDKFASQLGGENDSGWIFPAVSIMIPSILYAHTDSKNAIDKDITVQLNVSLDCNSITDKDLVEKYREETKHNSLYIPVSIIFYQRQCVSRYSMRMRKITQYQNSVETCVKGRKLIAELMSYGGTEYDYRLRFFNKRSYLEEYKRCIHMPDHTYKGRIFVTHECIDRSVSEFCEIIKQ